MVSLPRFSHCTRYEFRFCWTLQYFCILQGQLLSNSSSDKLCAVSSYIGFSSDSCLLARFAQGGISLNTAMIFFSLQSQLLPPRRERGLLAWESGLLTNRLAKCRVLSMIWLYFEITKRMLPRKFLFIQFIACTINGDFLIFIAIFQDSAYHIRLWPSTEYS